MIFFWQKTKGPPYDFFWQKTKGTPYDFFFDKKSKGPPYDFLWHIRNARRRRRFVLGPISKKGGPITNPPLVFSKNRQKGGVVSVISPDIIEAKYVLINGTQKARTHNSKLSIEKNLKINPHLLIVGMIYKSVPEIQKRREWNLAHKTHGNFFCII